MSTRGQRPSMREGPLSELFRSTDPSAPPPLGPPEPEPDHGPYGDASNYVAVIRVVGVGGAGCNAVNRMIEAGLRGVEFVAVNTDRQALEASDADVRIPVGMELTRGLGTGGDPHLGEQAIKESEDHVRRALRGSDLVFIAAGEGGGTGTGAAPVSRRSPASWAHSPSPSSPAPSPSRATSAPRRRIEGLERLQAAADTVIVIPNDRLMSVLERGTSMVEAFKVADDLLRQGVQGICDMITLPGLINLDFADVRTIIRGAGTALLGIGYAGGGNRATEAALAAIASPLLETPIDGAKGILLGVTGGPDLSLRRGQRGGARGGRRGRPRRQHHLRRDDRPGPAGPGVGHGGGRQLQRRPRRSGARRRAVRGVRFRARRSARRAPGGSRASTSRIRRERARRPPTAPRGCSTSIPRRPHPSPAADPDATTHDAPPSTPSDPGDAA